MEIIAFFTYFIWLTIFSFFYNHHLCCVASTIKQTTTIANNSSETKKENEFFSKFSGNSSNSRRSLTEFFVVGDGGKMFTSNSNQTITTANNLIEKYQPISNLTKLGKECSIIVDCNQIYYAHCDINYGECVCDNGYQAVRGTCIKVVTTDFSFWSQLLKQSPFIPILVVLAVMFVCLCLVLHLFSKARFRNQNRSIFVNPQNLKVAQAQERRLSQLSQLSANGLRTPRTTPSRSPNNSCSRSARSSYGSNVYSLNDPATINVTQHLYSPDSVLLKAKSRSNSISSSKLLT